VSRPRTRFAARLAAAGLALTILGASAAGAARPGDAQRRDARSLDARAHSALLDLYALDSQLHEARARLAALEREAAQLRHEQTELTQRLAATRHTLVASQRQLGQNLSLLYKQGDIDELAVVLGAQSLDDALTRVDDLNRVADESRQVVEVTTLARGQLIQLSAVIAERRARLTAAVVAAQSTEASLDAARNARVAFVERLRRDARLKRAQVHALESAAQRVVHKAAALQTAATPTATAEAAADTAAAIPAATSGRTITVTSTGYSLPGRTATGMPVGWGVVAVDPAVIPLGTRLTIPGYGEAVAADTGGAVRGTTVDLWFPTLAQARAWGRRTVTITLH
jgi:peptidoglycan DL-endopeptidase CwlO